MHHGDYRPGTPNEWQTDADRPTAYGSDMNDLYEVLQVHRRAEPEVIQAAYRALARKYHPDFGGEPSRMTALNDAWGVLGDQARRAAYDSQPQVIGHGQTVANPTTGTANSQPMNGDGKGLGGRRPQTPSGSGTVLDFGRYAGWTIGSLADHDTDYLEWLMRTPIGRPLIVEIDAALAQRAARVAALRPSVQPASRRRSLIRPWAAEASSAR